MDYAAPNPRLRHPVVSMLHSLWAHVVFWPTATLTWFAVVVLLPNLKLRWKAMQLALRFLLRISGIELTIRGREHLPGSDRTFLCIANHASYLDALLLVLMLPWPVSFVAKAELRGNLFTRLLLQRIGAVFVDRFNARQGLSDLQSMTQRVRRRDRLLIFPEGTFTRAPGLRPFRMGAFVTAARTGTPLFPIALRGSRALLRGDSWRLDRGEVVVTFLPLIDPADHQPGTDPWTQALALRSHAFMALLEHCGEPAAQQRQTPRPPARPQTPADHRASR